MLTLALSLLTKSTDPSPVEKYSFFSDGFFCWLHDGIFCFAFIEEALANRRLPSGANL